MAEAGQIEFMPYSPEFFEDVIQLHREAKNGLETGISDEDEEADLRAIEETYFKSGGIFLIGLMNGRVVAMGGFQRISGGSAELRRMRVKDGLQGQGIGSELLERLEESARNQGILSLQFETAKARPLTLKFYHDRGYQELGFGYYGAIETVHFQKRL